MIQLILAGAFFLPAQLASIPCANVATQTQQVLGRDQLVAVLKVSIADDHDKNSHDCQAEYQLLVMRAKTAGAPIVVDLLSSDADWDRSLSLRLNGFSQNGTRVFGVLSEDGKFPFTRLFDYDTINGKVRLIDLKKPLAHFVAEKCSSTFDVIGTSASGAIVLNVNSANCLPSNERWLLSRSGERAQRLPQGVTVLSLYEFKDDAP